MAIVKKQIKFDLAIDGVKVKTVEELREHITVEIVEHFKRGLLLKWLLQRDFELAEQFKQINQHQEDREILIDIITALGEIELDDQIIDALFEIPVKTKPNLTEAKEVKEAIICKIITAVTALIQKRNNVTDDLELHSGAAEQHLLKWYTKATEGNPVAQFNLGRIYRNGDGTPIDHKKALYWFLKAAQQGHPSAQFYLGCSYFNGDGLTADKQLAKRWFQLAAKQGLKAAQEMLNNKF